MSDRDENQSQQCGVPGCENLEIHVVRDDNGDLMGICDQCHESGDYIGVVQDAE